MVSSTVVKSYLPLRCFCTNGIHLNDMQNSLTS
nr:MAG TPA: Natrin 1, CRISP, serine protease, ion.58A [Caudoviricetes sp.]